MKIFSKNKIQEIIKKFKTPIVIYNEKIIIDNYKKLQRSLPSNAKIVYSVKANPNPEIIKILYRCGAFFETASYGEFALLNQIGIPGKRILYSGQAKSYEGIETALCKGVLLFNLESLNEIKMLTNLCIKLNKKANCMIRINPKIKTNNAMLKMGSVPSPFGIDENEIAKAISLLKNTTVSLNGFFMYNGSQYYDYNDIYNNTEYLIKFANEIEKNFNLNFQSMDFGGGFGVIESASQQPIDLLKLKEKFEKLNCEFQKYNMVFFESGRFLTSNSAVLVSRVVDVKDSYGKRFAILDSGINNLGIKQFNYRAYEPFIESITSALPEMEQILVGPTCTTIDNVHQSIVINELQVNDYISILDCGAYLLSYSPIHFCGHQTPAEVLIDVNENIHVIRNRESLEFSCGHGFKK